MCIRRIVDQTGQEHQTIQILLRVFYYDPAVSSPGSRAVASVPLAVQISDQLHAAHETLLSNTDLETSHPGRRLVLSPIRSASLVCMSQFSRPAHAVVDTSVGSRTPSRH